MDASGSVLFREPEVVPWLRSMELDKERLIEIVQYADSQRALCTQNDVRGFDLITVHDKAARGLREVYCGDRWEKDETDNQAGIRNPHLKIRVIPCNFDEQAGSVYGEPTNRVPKGTASRSKTFLNRTGWIPGLPVPEPTMEHDEFTTWILGICSEDDMPLKAELSRPLAFSNNQYTLLRPRIILLSGNEEPASPIRKSTDENGPVKEVDIAIRRK